MIRRLGDSSWQGNQDRYYSQRTTCIRGTPDTCEDLSATRGNKNDRMAFSKDTEVHCCSSDSAGSAYGVHRLRDVEHANGEHVADCDWRVPLHLRRLCGRRQSVSAGLPTLGRPGKQEWRPP